MLFIAVLMVVALACAACTTGLIRHAARWGLQDVPNDRSSHDVPRPRGAGVAIGLAALLGGVLLTGGGGLSDTPIEPMLLARLLPDAATGPIPPLLMLAALTLLMLLGFRDDLRPLGFESRLLVQGACVLLILLACPLPAPLQDWTTPTLLMLLLPLLLAGTWWLNLFNFMDGIDGLATCQAIFMLGAGVWLGSEGDTGLMLLFALPTLAALVGFLPFNAPPARIFMGDAGSLLLGGAILLVGCLGSSTGSLPVTGWLLLGSLFIMDATVTLLVRFRLGQRLTDGHRSHVYQRLSRRLGGHRPALAVYCGLNLALLLPLAGLVRSHPSWGVVVLLITWTGIAAAAWWLGAGRPEPETAQPGSRTAA